jgi:2-polyprenyl-3-methyl-5-hydroxy-6-metoxy-1,4-benzoquinol methylase
MHVWNEEICLPCALAGLLHVVDELVIVDGGPKGPSTDSTKQIIDGCIAAYPGKIKYLSGTYLRDDGTWDETRQVNDGLAKITGDYVIRMTADIVIDEADLLMIRDIIERYPEKLFYYAPVIDFGGDTDHIILQGRMVGEELLPRELVLADGLVWNMAANLRAVEVGEARVYGMVTDVDYDKDILYMPHVKRFHYGYVKSFASLVHKYVGLVYNRQHDNWQELQAAGEQTMVAEGMNWVRNLKNTLPLQPYTGTYPVNGEPLRGMDVMDGYEEFMEEYKQNYLGDHSRPNAEGWIDRVPTDEEVLQFNENRMPVQQPPLTLESIGMNPIEAFLASIIQHYYPDAGANVLDVGCGNGKFLTALLHGGFIGAGGGIDASPTMVANAQQTATNVGVAANFVVGSIESLPIDTRFDVIIATELLEHLYNAVAGVGIMASLLKRGGMLCGTVPLWNTCDCDAHLQYFSTESLRGLLERFFLDVGVSSVDLTGAEEYHIRYTARLPKELQSDDC